MYENGAKNGLFPTLTDLEIEKMPFFPQKLFNKIYFKDILWGIDEF